MNYDDYSNYDLYDEECTGQPPDADQSLIVPRRGLEPDSGPDDEPMIVERRGSPADTDSLVFEEDMDECPDEYIDDCDNLDAVILPYLTGSKPGKKKRKQKHKKKSKKKASASSKGVNLLELAAFVGGGDEDAQFTDGEQESPAKGRFRQPSVCQMEDELLEKAGFIYRKTVLYYYNGQYYEPIDAEGVIALYRQYISPGLDGVKNLRNHMDIYKCLKADPRLKYEDEWQRASKNDVDRELINSCVAQITPLTNEEFRWALDFQMSEVRARNAAAYTMDGFVEMTRFSISFEEAKAFKASRNQGIRKNEGQDLTVVVGIWSKTQK